MNLERLKDRIRHSGELTALQKRYLLGKVDAEPMKHGKWIKYPCVYECSNCGAWIHRDLNNPPMIRFQKYCYSCGAKMGETHEDEKRDNRLV